MSPVRYPGRGRLLRPILLALIAVVAAGPIRPAFSQEKGRGGGEIELLREAATLEAAGDLAGAETVLVELLEAWPESLSALLAYERVARAQGRLANVLPAVERQVELDPGSSVPRQIQLRTLSFLDRTDELEAAAESWLEARPRLEAPYREVAKIWEERGEFDRALRTLERGREQVGRRDALALEIGSVHLARGDARRAAEAWDLAIGPEARGLSLVRRRLGALPDGGASVLPVLIERLAASSAPLRQRAAVELALEAGLEARAEAIARELVDRLEPDARMGFLIEIARRADGARLQGIAYWAYDGVVRLEAERGAARDEEAGELLAIRARLGDLALALGDTTAARKHYQVVEKAYAVGSPERRRAVALRIGLLARDGRVDEALAAFDEYREEFPAAPELDALVAEVGSALIDRGERTQVERILTGITGPRTSLLRGRIALLDGELRAARSAFLSAAQKLGGAEATEAIALATLLGRLSTEGGQVIANGLAAADRDGEAASVAAIIDGSAGLEREERAALLAFAAREADRAGLTPEAERALRILVDEYPDTREAPDALLRLARTLAEREGGAAEARALLERLILDYPRSALVPQARREYERLGGPNGP